MIIEALQSGSLPEFRNLLDEARGKAGELPLTDGQFTALCHAVRGNELEIYVARENQELAGFTAAATWFSLSSCRYEAAPRGRYIRPEFQGCGLEERLEEYLADALKIRGLSLSGGC